MSNLQYLDKINPIIQKIDEQSDKLKEVAKICSEVINSGKLVHLFGSGTSLLPVFDMFPRYGCIMGFHPLVDPNLMWPIDCSVSGQERLTSLERSEGYIEKFLDSYNFQENEAVIIFSHSGANAITIDAANYFKNRGLKVIAVSSLDNYVDGIRPSHSTGKRLYDLADIFIDNGCPLEDGIVAIENYPYSQKVGATSTLAAITIAQIIESETATLLQKMNYKMYVMVAPCVEDRPRDWSEHVLKKYSKLLKANKN